MHEPVGQCCKEKKENHAVEDAVSEDKQTNDNIYGRKALINLVLYSSVPRRYKAAMLGLLQLPTRSGQLGIVESRLSSRQRFTPLCRVGGKTRRIQANQSNDPLAVAPHCAFRNLDLRECCNVCVLLLLDQLAPQEVGSCPSLYPAKLDACSRGEKCQRSEDDHRWGKLMAAGIQT
jgi:hypothetical protein